MIQYGNGICAVPPGERIKEELKCLGLGNKEEFVARSLELTLPEFRELLEGGLSIDEELADKLADELGIEKTYWLALERQYQKSLDIIRSQNESV